MQMSDSFPTYPHHTHMLAYLESYAERFDILSHIQFNSTVNTVVKEGNTWLVTYQVCVYSECDLKILWPNGW